MIAWDMIRRGSVFLRRLQQIRLQAYTIANGRILIPVTAGRDAAASVETGTPPRRSRRHWPGSPTRCAEPVVLCIRPPAPVRRVPAEVGFIEVEGFAEYGAEQRFGVRPAAATSG